MLDTFAAHVTPARPGSEPVRAAVHHFRVAEKQQDEGRKAVFRIPRTSFMAIALLTICVTPIALGEIPYLEWLYLFPIALAVFVVRTRTVATRDGLAIRTMFGKRDVPWSALKGLAITKKARVQAVLKDDTKVPLPTVRTRHLPVLSLVSDGLVADPSGQLSAEDIQPGASETSAGE
ncbi:PH domain-containing protein [Amycolatopsis balhimycina DSM 5908]|uniref:PH domain-containing protein n=1 Tax=Amycolatopsis balhimycina DSM 5908 TaxID=1081091 RepID=A0A428WCV8_AMYBA|nr:PH domain-containing protein [Amycolatopsis balhimycina DSM 5908]